MIAADVRISLTQKRFWERDQSRRRSPAHPVLSAIYEPRARYLRSLVSDISAPSVLDVGCGAGAKTYYLRRYFPIAYGVDFSHAMLHANPLPDRVCADAARLPFATHSFDVVTCSHLLHHLPCESRMAAVREFARIAKRWIVLYEPNRNNPAMLLFALLKPAEWMAVRFSRRYLIRLSESAGLQVVHHQVEGTILPNKTPVKLLRFAQWLDRTPFRRFGFYARVTAHPKYDLIPPPTSTTRSASPAS